MRVAQLDIGPAEALVRLRAHAYATGRSATPRSHATSSITAYVGALLTADRDREPGFRTPLSPWWTSLLHDFDVVDLLTELTERCAQLLDVA